MTTLKCSAVTCYYNQDRLCSKGEIIVEGQDAKRMEETCCGSFKERGNSMSNSVRPGATQISVCCDAVTCVHNCDRKCAADKVGINGPGATGKCDTECHTFECKCGC